MKKKMEKKRRTEGVLIIKRYPNRKLYDTEKSCYVTLETLAQLIQDGREICVIDNNTSQDITSSTLTQIIFEVEKRSKGVLPIPTLQHIIRSGESMTQFLQKRLRNSVNSLQHAKLGVEESVKDLFENRTKNLDDLSQKIDEKIKATLGSLSSMSYKRRFEDLQRKVTELEHKLERLRASSNL